MPNSTELKGVIQTPTVNSAHCALAAALLRLGDGRVRAEATSMSLMSLRARISALASRAASAAAASAWASITPVLLPSAMLGLRAKGAPERGTEGRRSGGGDVSTPE